MTNLQFGFPDIPLNALTITPDLPFDEMYPVTNLVTGRRSSMARLAADISGTYTLDIVYDLGADNTQAVNYIALCRADLLKALPITTMSISGSDDDSTYYAAISIIAFDSKDLVGPDGNDYIQTASTSTAYRYWRMRYTSNVDGWRLTHSKLFFGSLFDFDSEVSDWRIDRKTRTGDLFVADSGASHTMRTDQPRYSMSGVWQGVTDTTLESFKAKIGHKLHKVTAVLYSPGTWSNLLDGKTLIHAEITKIRARKTHRNYNEVILDMEELIG
jgi:hypothetical protein